MAWMLRPRRGTTTQNASLVGGVGEVTVDTTKSTIRVHDGSTTGGTELARTSDVPTKVSQLTNDSGYLTTHQDLSAYALTSSIPTKTSQLTNDSGYLTSHQSLASCLKTTGGTISGNLAVTGTCTVSGALQGKTVKATSDRRLKENLTTPTYDLSSLKAYRYTFTGEPVYHVGLIAQEVERVIPEAVAEGENGYLALDYNAVVAALVNAVNSLQAQINQLKEAKNG